MIQVDQIPTKTAIDFPAVEMRRRLQALRQTSLIAARRGDYRQVETLTRRAARLATDLEHNGTDHLIAI